MNQTFKLFTVVLFTSLSTLFAGDTKPADAETVAEPARLPFDIAAEPAVQELSPEFCWFHPRAAAIPGAGTEGKPAVMMTLMKHLAADDHYSGLYFMRTDDLGRTWTRPAAIPELAWRKQSDDITVAVIDTTPGWHAKSGRLLVIGARTLYTASGDYASLQTMPRSYETSYATYDPAADRWSGWKELEMPETDGKFFRAGCGCSQWLVKPDGSLLVPVQFQPKQGGDYQNTVLHCSFDGTEMKYLRHGTELSIGGGRGFAEPSLAHFQGKYFLTLRNDAAAYVATSDDGLNFGQPQAWTFDDGKDLGSYNTQAHWLTHSDGLFLSYTRRGANNDHIARHRAPLFVAQVNPQSLQVIRSTEQVLLPERGVMLGNFGASAITPNESWVTDAEFISRLVDPDAGQRPHPKGADGTVWVGRVKWSKPNSLAMTSSDGKPHPDAKAPADRGAGASTIVTVSKSTPELPRKGEGDVIELTDGRLLLVSMEFGGDGSDFASTRFVSHESSDGGLTWGQHRVITETLKGDLNVYSPNLIRAKDGGILLLFMRQHRPGSLTNHVWKSTDEGQTFSPLAEFVPKRDFAIVQCHGEATGFGTPASACQSARSRKTGRNWSVCSDHALQRRRRPDVAGVRISHRAAHAWGDGTPCRTDGRRACADGDAKPAREAAFFRIHRRRCHMEPRLRQFPDRAGIVPRAHSDSWHERPADDLEQLVRSQVPVAFRQTQSADRSRFQGRRKDMAACARHRDRSDTSVFEPGLPLHSRRPRDHQLLDL